MSSVSNTKLTYWIDAANPPHVNACAYGVARCAVPLTTLALTSVCLCLPSLASLHVAPEHYLTHRLVEEGVYPDTAVNDLPVVPHAQPVHLSLHGELSQRSTWPAD